MPRFYFHRSNGCLLIDDEGVELPCPETARAHGADLVAGALWRGRDPSGIAFGSTLMVTDDQCQTVATYAAYSTLT